MRSPNFSKKAQNCHLALALDQQHMLTSLAAGKKSKELCINNKSLIGAAVFFRKANAKCFKLPSPV